MLTSFNHHNNHEGSYYSISEVRQLRLSEIWQLTQGHITIKKKYLIQNLAGFKA